MLQLILTAASVAVPWTQQFRRPHVVRDLEVPSGTSCRLQTARKPAASAVIPCRCLAAAFLRIQCVGAGQIYQRDGGEGGERKRASALALVVLPSARCDGCDIGKIASHPGPNPGFRIVASQMATPVAISRAPYPRRRFQDLLRRLPGRSRPAQSFLMEK